MALKFYHNAIQTRVYIAAKIFVKEILLCELSPHNTDFGAALKPINCLIKWDPGWATIFLMISGLLKKYTITLNDRIRHGRHNSDKCKIYYTPLCNP